MPKERGEKIECRRGEGGASSGIEGNRPTVTTRISGALCVFASTHTNMSTQMNFGIAPIKTYRTKQHPSPGASRHIQKDNGRKPLPGRGRLPLSNPKLVWVHFFFCSKAIYHGEAPNKTPLAIVLPVTQTNKRQSTNPWRLLLLRLVSVHPPTC